MKLIKRIKSIVRKWIVIVWTTLVCIIEEKSFEKNIKENKQVCCLLTGTPVYGNIGDIAITSAEIKLLRDNNIAFLEVPITVAKWYRKRLAEKMPQSVKILNQGGGNMGIQWFNAEIYRREDLCYFFEHDIIVFPQTLYYGNSKRGIEELENSIKSYSKNKERLHLFAREKISYEQMKKLYPLNDVQLVPDIVLYLNKMERTNKRKGIIFVVRSDKEKNISNEQMGEFIKLAKKIDADITITDTVINRMILKNNRKKILEKKLEQFGKAKLVVTDRLHGMIFSIITGTPCVVVSNSNHKIRGVYEWVKDLKNVQFVEDFENMQSSMEKLYNTEAILDNNCNFISYYQKILNIIKKDEREKNEK